MDSDSKPDKGKSEVGTKDTSSRGTGGSAQDDLKRAAEGTRDTARRGAERATDEAKGRAETMKAQAGEQVEDTASALDSAADELAAEGHEGLAEVVSKISGNLGDLASRLESKSVDDLLQDAGRLAQRNPLLFVAGSVAAGVMLSRFLKAHARSRSGYPSTGYGHAYDRDDSPGRDYYRDRDYGPGGDHGRYASERELSGQSPTQSGFAQEPIGGTPRTPRPGEANTDEQSGSNRGGER